MGTFDAGVVHFMIIALFVIITMTNDAPALFMTMLVHRGRIGDYGRVAEVVDATDSKSVILGV